MGSSHQELPQVVILGAGFAGAAAVQHLAHADVAVTVVDQRPYNTFRPLLYQVATGGVNPGDITYPLRNLSARNNARYRRARVVGIDPRGASRDPRSGRADRVRLPDHRDR